MATKICSNCYQVNTINGISRYCMWCGYDLREEEILDAEDSTSQEWLETIAIAAKIQNIKAKQFINSFDKDAVLNDDRLLRTWWLAHKSIEVRQSRVSS